MWGPVATYIVGKYFRGGACFFLSFLLYWNLLSPFSSTVSQSQLKTASFRIVNGTFFQEAFILSVIENSFALTLPRRFFVPFQANERASRSRAASSNDFSCHKCRPASLIFYLICSPEKDRPFDGARLGFWSCTDSNCVESAILQSRMPWRVVAVSFYEKLLRPCCCWPSAGTPLIPQELVADSYVQEL